MDGILHMQLATYLSPYMIGTWTLPFGALINTSILDRAELEVFSFTIIGMTNPFGMYIL